MMRCVRLCLALLPVLALPARAQRADSTRKAVAPPAPAVTSPAAQPDTNGPRPEIRPPLSPRQAFAVSFLLPGYAQSTLGRPRASALFIAFEAVAVTMLRQAQFDLHQARNAGADSVVVSWVDAGSGQVRQQFKASPYDATLLRSRRAHVEDWVAALVANHLFAGLDAYVAANLWDVPAELSVRATPNGAAVTASVPIR
ncbi:MAG TPA: hypothetical protein VG818_04730 [Gemmatimonadaceae bacterium]|jgi:hypothetical protein|nr:hypothetical protein [Gemmatimonadaceae bacterium]